MTRNCDRTECRRPLQTDDPAVFFCSTDCRILHHRNITRAFERPAAPPPRPVSPGVMAVLADRAAGRNIRRTLSTGQAWSALADEAGRYSAYHDRVRKETGR